MGEEDGPNSNGGGALEPRRVRATVPELILVRDPFLGPDDAFPGATAMPMSRFRSQFSVVGILAAVGMLAAAVAVGCTSSKKSISEPTCSGAGCECSILLTGCGEQCVAPAQDPDHCGGCNRRCGDSQVCSGGVCKAACDQGLVLCGRSCVDTLHNVLTCGGCDQSCQEGETCESGQCLLNGGLPGETGGSGGSGGTASGEDLGGSGGVESGTVASGGAPSDPASGTGGTAEGTQSGGASGVAEGAGGAS